MPRSARSQFNRILFSLLRRFFEWLTRFAKTFAQKAAIFACYAPIGLMLLVPTWYMLMTLLDVPYTPNAALCIRAGFLSLRKISDSFGITYPPDPHFPEVPISISSVEFDDVLDLLQVEGLPLKDDRDQAWQDFAVGALIMTIPCWRFVAW